MSAKTCLLCGRPLGRMRPGAGSDFCSREHRNQYTLRRSIECLTEANKVATLARRRENLKALDCAPAGAEIPEPHGTTEALSFLVNRGPRRPALRRPRLDRALKISMPQAGMVSGQRLRGSSMGPRAFEFHLTTPTGRSPGTIPPRVLQSGPARLTAMPAFRQPRPDPHSGNAFSVPERAKFRPGAPLLRSVKITRPQGSMGRTTQGRILDLNPSRGVSVPWVCRADIPRPASWAPPAPPVAAARFAWPGAAAVSLRPATLPEAPRTAVLAFGVPRQPVLPLAGATPAHRGVGPQGVSRLRSIPAGMPARLAEQRLAFEEIAFPGAPDAPATLKWVEAVPQKLNGFARGGL